MIHLYQSTDLKEEKVRFALQIYQKIHNTVDELVLWQLIDICNSEKKNEDTKTSFILSNILGKCLHTLNSSNSKSNKAVQMLNCGFDIVQKNVVDSHNYDRFDGKTSYLRALFSCLNDQTCNNDFRMCIIDGLAMYDGSLPPVNWINILLSLGEQVKHHQRIANFIINQWLKLCFFLIS